MLAAIDKHRKVWDTDYIDSMLVHCTVKDGWTDAMKRVLGGFNEAKEKKWIRAKGASCHSLPALRTAAASDWTEIHLVRVNPQGAHMNTPAETWNAKSDETHVSAVMKEIKTMHAKGHGVIGVPNDHLALEAVDDVAWKGSKETVSFVSRSIITRRYGAQPQRCWLPSRCGLMFHGDRVCSHLEPMVAGRRTLGSRV